MRRKVHWFRFEEDISACNRVHFHARKSDYCRTLVDVDTYRRGRAVIYGHFRNVTCKLCLNHLRVKLLELELSDG